MVLTHFSGKLFLILSLIKIHSSDETHTEVLFNLEFDMEKNVSYSKRHTPKWTSSNPDDITRWPKCSASIDEMREIGTKAGRDIPPWMSCNVNARPCCIGTEGQCKIVSKDYCDTMEVRADFAISLLNLSSGKMEWRRVLVLPSGLFKRHLRAHPFSDTIHARPDLPPASFAFHPRWNSPSLHHAFLPG